jgi:hypothetical protein
MYSNTSLEFSTKIYFTPLHLSSLCHRQHDTNEIQRLAVKDLQLFEEEVTSLRQEFS